MARTALTPVTLSRDAGVSQGAGATPDATNGNIVASPGPYNAIIAVKNGDASAHNMIVRGSGYTGAANGAANSGLPAPQNMVFAKASVGDITVAVAAGATVWFTASDTDQYTQPDGSVWLDWSASTSMTVWVLTQPYPVA